MKSSKQIAAEIKELKKEYNKALEKESKSPYTKEVMKIAEMLHKYKCTSNHADACGWYYDNGNWSEYSRKEYAEKAINLLDKINFTTCKMFLEIVSK